MKLKPLHILLFSVLLIYTSCSERTSTKENEKPSDAMVRSDSMISSDYVIILPKDTISFKSTKGNYSFRIEQTDSTEFFQFYDICYYDQPQPKSITDIDSLKEAVDIEIDIQTDHGISFINSMHLLNGKVLKLNVDYEAMFIAYYPEYNFILMEGGHNSDEGYDLVTGYDIYDAGNPSDQTISPNLKYRISGVFNGQECSTYIIQKKMDDKYSKMAKLEHPDLCYFIRSFWKDDTTFYYSMRTARFDSVNGTMQYFKLHLPE